MSEVIAKYTERIQNANSLLCVGLDTDVSRIPAEFQKHETPQFAFNRWVIEQTHPYVSAYKPNIAFYEGRGRQGWEELALTIAYLRQNHPDILTICDAKRGDIGTSNEGYVTEIFDILGFDAVTLHPFIGKESLQPFLKRTDKGCIILCRTSNTGAGEFQDLLIGDDPLWKFIATRVSNDWNENGNCMLVVGATYPDELKGVREIVGDMTLLIPGVGAQGGTIQGVMEAGLNSSGEGLIVSISRDIIYSDNPGDKSAWYEESINEWRALTRQV